MRVSPIRRVIVRRLANLGSGKRPGPDDRRPGSNLALEVRRSSAASLETGLKNKPRAAIVWSIDSVRGREASELEKPNPGLFGGVPLW
jgi:hypothetical protein